VRRFIKYSRLSKGWQAVDKKNFEFAQVIHPTKVLINVALFPYSYMRSKSAFGAGMISLITVSPLSEYQLSKRKVSSIYEILPVRNLSDFQFIILP
jgi:hypothetical protein